MFLIKALEILSQSSQIKGVLQKKISQPMVSSEVTEPLHLIGNPRGIDAINSNRFLKFLCRAEYEKFYKFWADRIDKGLSESTAERVLEKVRAILNMQCALGISMLNEKVTLVLQWFTYAEACTEGCYALENETIQATRASELSCVAFHTKLFIRRQLRATLEVTELYAVNGTKKLMCSMVQANYWKVNLNLGVCISITTLCTTQDLQRVFAG